MVFELLGMLWKGIKCILAREDKLTNEAQQTTPPV